MPVAAVQTRYRFRSDTLTVDSASPVWAAAENTTWVPTPVQRNTPFRLRFEIQNTGSTSTGAQTFNLFVARNAGAYAQIAAGGFVSPSTAASTDADNTVLATRRLTADAGTYVNGQIDETGATGSITLTASTVTELEFCIVFNDAAVVGDTYDFRVYRGGSTALNTYTQTPRVTITQANPVAVVVSVTPPVFVNADLNQIQVLPTATNYVNGSPTFDAPNLTSGAPSITLTATPITVGLPSVNASSIAQGHVLATPAFATAPYVIAVSTLGQGHALLPINAVAGVSVFGTPVAAAISNLTATSFATAPYVLGAPALTGPIVTTDLFPAGFTVVVAYQETIPAFGLSSPSDILHANNLIVGNPSVSVGTVKQVHPLAATSLAIAPPISIPAATAAISVNATAISFAVGVPSIGAPALGVIVNSTATNVADSAPTLGTPTMGAVTNLLATSFAVGLPAYTTPALGKVLASISLSVGLPVFSSAVPGTALLVTSASAGPPAFGAPALVAITSPTALSAAAGLPTFTAPALGKVLAATSASAGVPIVDYSTLTKTITSTPASAGAPVLGVPSMITVIGCATTGITVGLPTLAVGSLVQKHVLAATSIAALPYVIDAAVLGQAGVMTPIPVAAGLPVIGTGTFGQKHLVTAQALATSTLALGSSALGKVLQATVLAVSIPTLGAPALGKVLAATSSTTGLPIFGVPALTPIAGVGPIGISTVAPTVGAAAIGQGHAFVASITIGLPTFTVPAFSTAAGAAAIPLVTSAPVIGQPAFVQKHVLVATAAAAGPPALATGFFGQAGVMAALPPVLPAPTIGASAISQQHVLMATAYAGGSKSFGQPVLIPRLLPAAAVAGVPVLGQPAIGQRHAMAAAAAIAGPPVIGVGALTFIPQMVAVAPSPQPSIGQGILKQRHALAAAAAISGRPLIDAGFIGQAGVMAAIPLWVQPPIMPTAAFGQRASLAAAKLEIGALTFGIPELIANIRLPRPWSTFAGHLEAGAATLGQGHRITALAAICGAPISLPAVLKTTNNAFAAVLAVGVPSIGTPAAKAISRLTAASLTNPPALLGSPQLDQRHQLTASALVILRPSLTRPGLSGALQSLDAIDTAVGVPGIGTPLLGLIKRHPNVVHITGRRDGGITVAGQRGGTARIIGRRDRAVA